nr:kynureninase [Bacteroidota bacterium]
LQAIEEHGSSIALIMLGGVNYYTGQAFDMRSITAAAHRVGAKAGYDLAHAAGNLLLSLHDWDVDFAVWCSYKYLNSGPGGVGGAFVHERWADSPTLPRLAGWWGYDKKTRFLMRSGFNPMHGAAGWQLSNAQVIPMAFHKASLDIFDEAGMTDLRQKSERLTGFLDFLIRDNIKNSKAHDINLITPQEAAERGAQLSIRVKAGGKDLFSRITSRGVVADWREPDVIRVAPVPLYNTFEEAYHFAHILFS